MTSSTLPLHKNQCSHCNKNFTSKSDLDKHVRVHTNQRPYVCLDCGQTFKQLGSFKGHQAAKHAILKNGYFVCNICEKYFPLKERLKLHLRTHAGIKPYKCKLCDKQFARGGGLAQHLRTHDGLKPYGCKLCGAHFTSSANLTNHAKRHLGLRDYMCHICGKAFYRIDGLKKHLNCYHNNIKAYRCDICNKDLKGHLGQHMKMHLNTKPHGCAHCGSRFAQRSQLTVHQRIHSGEKPYRCEVCWKAFAYSTTLKLHKRCHTGEKPFKCLLCDASFIQLPHLKKHMLCVHKTKDPYVCKYCKQFYKTKMLLEKHTDNCQSRDSDNFKNQVDDDKIESRTPLHRMRFLLAILLKKISTPDRLKKLGFDKRLIDDVLCSSLKLAGKNVCKDDNLSNLEKLKNNVGYFLEWTIPTDIMLKYKKEQKSIEELLEELAST